MNNISELNLKMLLEHAHIGVVIHFWDTSIAYANPTALKLLRLTYQQIIGKDAFDAYWSFLDESGKPLPIEDYPVNKVKRTKERLSNEILGVVDSSSDTVSWFMVNGYYQGEDEDEQSFIVITFNDITDSKQLFSFQDIVENTQDVVIVTEAENIDSPAGPKIIYVNHAFEQLTGYKQHDILGETPRILQGALTDKDATKRILSALKQQQAVSETLLNYDINGRPYWVEMNIIPLRNQYHEVTHFAAIQRDISSRKFMIEQLEKRNQDLKLLKQELENRVKIRTMELQKAKAKLEEIAFLDPLTNIPNRRFFIDQAQRLIKFCNRRKLMVAFGLLDIDDFKSLNDKHGHDVGDVVLKELANYFQHFFRAEDVFCRYGGEEFAFAIAIEKLSNVESLAARLLEGIERLEIKFATGVRISFTASVGFKLCQTTQSVDLEKEIKQADVALYQSKELGKNRYTIFF